MVYNLTYGGMAVSKIAQRVKQNGQLFISYLRRNGCK